MAYQADETTSNHSDNAPRPEIRMSTTATSDELASLSILTLEAKKSMTLNDRIQALCAELFNKVFSFTVTTNNELGPRGLDQVIIDSSYKPPVCVQLARATRSAFAASYYITTDFHFVVEAAHPTDVSLDRCQVFKWLDSIPAEHTKAIRSITLKRTFASSWDGAANVNDASWLARSEVHDIMEELESRGFYPGHLWVNYYLLRGDGDPENESSYENVYCQWGELVSRLIT